jgi:glycosyltransferase involved in cell wall biosynthesis
MKKKIAIYTEALGPIKSGGIRCIIYFLNILKERGYDVCAFVDYPPFDSTWLKSDFPVYSSVEVEKYDGILISPYSPTAEKVSMCKNANKRIYWVHTLEFCFYHNPEEWLKRAVFSYRFLKNIYYMATSHYVKIFLELIFKQKVLPKLVRGGVDLNVFKVDPDIYREKIRSDKVRFCMLNRPEPLRGIKIGVEAFEKLRKDFGDKVELFMFSNIPQEEMYKAYGKAHFFVDPSLLAGLPLPPLEAMACETVPLVTHFGSNDYILDGNNGFFINANDVEDTYRVMKYVTTKYLESKTENDNLWYECRAVPARIAVMEDFSWKKMIDNFEENLTYLES